MNDFMTKYMFEPDELNGLKEIYDDITAKPWFRNDPDTLKSLAKYLFETFPGSTYDEAQHRAVVEQSARMFFAADK